VYDVSTVGTTITARIQDDRIIVILNETNDTKVEIERSLTRLW